MVKELDLALERIRIFVGHRFSSGRNWDYVFVVCLCVCEFLCCVFG